MTFVNEIIQLTTEVEDKEALLSAIVNRLAENFKAYNALILYHSGNGHVESEVKASAIPIDDRSQYAINYAQDTLGTAFTRDDATFVPAGESAMLGVVMDTPLTTDQHQILVTVGNVLGQALRVQSLENKLDELGRFNSMMIHELRAPLSHVIGWSALLSEHDMDIEQTHEKLHHYLTIIHNSANQVDVMLEQLRTIMKLDTDRLAFRAEPVPVNTSILGILDIYRALISDKGQTLVQKLAEDLPPVLADSNRFHQVLMILMDNAYKYTPREGCITVYTEHAPDPLDCVRITIEDTGIGVRPADQRRLFQRFYRTANERVLDQPGTGLGLYIVKRIMELHKGQVKLESTVDEGTRITVSFPVAPPTAD